MSNVDGRWWNEWGGCEWDREDLSQICCVGLLGSALKSIDPLIIIITKHVRCI